MKVLQEIKGIQFVDTGGTLGRAVIAGRGVKEGEILWREAPLDFLRFPSSRCRMAGSLKLTLARCRNMCHAQ
jgi:hypothetical protein